ncbi:MAG: zinc ribbon domain-containing protein [Spirochaetaceae bacterium]|nr:zinc ribbon domain-containing protein [Spirochaetaceae bacterium]
MPTYDYECRSCGYRFETFQSMSDDSLSTCPDCGKEQLRRLISGGTGVIFKGSGFYVNDSRKSSSTTMTSTSETAFKKAETDISGSGKSETLKSDSGKTESKKTDSSKSGSSESKSKASA